MSLLRYTCGFAVWRFDKVLLSFNRLGTNDVQLVDQFIRKGSTASLSHIEGSLNSRAVRPNMSSQSLVQLEGGSGGNAGAIEQMSVLSDSAVSPTNASSRSASAGKFFVFGGSRGAKKSTTKQRPQVCCSIVYLAIEALGMCSLPYPLHKPSLNCVIITCSSIRIPNAHILNTSSYSYSRD